MSCCISKLDLQRSSTNNALLLQLQQLQSKLIEQQLAIKSLQEQIKILNSEVVIPPTGSCYLAWNNSTSSWYEAPNDQIFMGCNPDLLVGDPSNINNVQLGTGTSTTHFGSNNTIVGPTGSLLLGDGNTMLGDMTEVLTIVGSGIKIGSGSSYQGFATNPIGIGYLNDTRSDSTNQILVSNTLNAIGPPSNGPDTIIMQGSNVGVGAEANSIAIGENAMFNAFLSDSIALGNTSGADSAGLTNSNVICMGYLAGIFSPGSGSIALGVGSSRSSLSTNTNVISLGTDAATNGALQGTIAIGNSSGVESQNTCISIGDEAGSGTQGDHCIAIGNVAGRVQDQNDIAIGTNTISDTNAVVIGNNIRSSVQGIAIGINTISTISNTIVINSGSTTITTTGTNKSYISDIDVGGIGVNAIPAGIAPNIVLLGYNTIDKEIIQII